MPAVEQPQTTTGVSSGVRRTPSRRPQSQGGRSRWTEASQVMGMGLRGTGHRKVGRALKRRGRRLFPGRVRLDVRKRERDGKLPSLPPVLQPHHVRPQDRARLTRGHVERPRVVAARAASALASGLRRTCPDQNETSRSQGAGERRSSSDERSFSQPMAVPASYLVAALHGGMGHLSAPGRTPERCGSVEMDPRKVCPNQLVSTAWQWCQPHVAAPRDQHTCALCLFHEQPSV